MRDGQLAVVTADRGTLLVDQVGGVKAKPVPRGGTLSGHVLLTIGPPESFVTGSTALQPGQVQATLDQDLDFDYARRELTSPGKIHVRSGRPSERMSFDGENLTVSFNRDQKRIEYLRIAHGDRMTIARPEQAFAGGGGAGGGERGSATAAASAPASATGGPASAGTSTARGDGDGLSAHVWPGCQDRLGQPHADQRSGNAGLPGGAAEGARGTHRAGHRGG